MASWSSQTERGPDVPSPGQAVHRADAGRCTDVRVRFHGYTVDLAGRQLSRGVHRVHLSPKAFETLEVLIERRPAAVSKEELLGRVWPGVFVTDASLARVIHEIRAAVGDSAPQGRTIRTVHTFGYAFVAAARRDAPDRGAGRTTPPTASLLVSSTRTVRLSEGEQVIGRDPRCDVWLDSPKVSWRHARIRTTRTGTIIEDLGSKNGTFVGRRRISTRASLRDGDEVRIGRVAFVFRAGRMRRVTETE